ncbi:sulfurtransferase TusA family protein [Halanaeroarchaeum sulfurireducens]|uniref:SirA family protein n=1 Tax=Halanaeroarchaeum sulfurireducens TaxID=1604004 RepID=A0A0F7PEC5_9EURY|nr:sulfurtransferase TusA family protein [Halanaeroarchaeum sulfurireducens]AKH98565.1 SirA family protein [Halanaeroarchaeum sulfurireducens]ALG83007.1 SirA family protein [Halanaeroarchaeum sulfurireducens]
MTEEIEADVTVDARGSACPGPLMDLIGKVKSVDSGTVVELLTGDEGSKNDVPEWVDEAGHEHLDTVDEGDYYSIYVQKS